MAKYDDYLLRPDAADYTFFRYFVYNFSEHKIEPNPGATAEDQQKAEITIEIFNLNHPGVKTGRRLSFERYVRDLAPDLNDYCYRFVFE